MAKSSRLSKLLGMILPVGLEKTTINCQTNYQSANQLIVSDDARTEIAAADCIVLPSYREGTPRTLLEAAALGRPIITTDTVGCREVVDDGDNGFLCQVGSAPDLAEKMACMLMRSVPRWAYAGARRWNTSLMSSL
jgi:glycosyltransferase involved in cell wall biosynthesis